MTPDNDSHLDAMFHAFSHRVRREITSMVSSHSLSIVELVPHFGMSFEAVSKHIRVLEQAGIVQREVRGRNHVCHLRTDAMKDAVDWLNGYQKFWQSRLDTLEPLLQTPRGD
jgi:DNA-binding transcriptional ArsR family regulator